jgi:hypothetical protein
VEGQGEIVIANPGFKEITQDIQRSSLRGGVLHELLKKPHGNRAIRRQMKI